MWAERLADAEAVQELLQGGPRLPEGYSAGSTPLSAGS
jgi:hypothetical protein